MAGLLAYSFDQGLPVGQTVACYLIISMEFTATGIAPDLHRIPFSSRTLGNQYGHKCRRMIYGTEIILFTIPVEKNIHTCKAKGCNKVLTAFCNK